MNNDFPTLLKELNLKVTPKRLAILTILASESKYLSPADVRQKLQNQFARISLSTVYRNLEELAAGGIVATIIHPTRQLYYYFCPNRVHHHHFVCLSCRSVEDMAYCSLQAFDASVTGQVLSHIVQVNGFCHTCVATAGGKT